MPVIVRSGTLRVLTLNPPREHGPAHVPDIKRTYAGERVGNNFVVERHNGVLTAKRVYLGEYA